MLRRIISDKTNTNVRNNLITASIIIHKGLGLEEVKVVRVLRKSGEKTRTGLLKIELESEEDVRKVLRSKSKLQSSNIKELWAVFLHASKNENVLVAERNEDTILREMGVRNEYVRLSSGHFGSKEESARMQETGNQNRKW